MTDPFVAEIRCFGFNFAPRNYAFCNGQQLPIAQNTALFSLLGVAYGGNGSTTFNLPNLQGRSACSVGQLPGGSNYVLGQESGTKAVTLDVTQLAPHGHTFKTVISSSNTAQNTPAAGSHLGRTFGQSDFTSTSNDTTLSNQMIGAAGSNQPHANQQPYLVINFCIALNGVFPSRQ